MKPAPSARGLFRATGKTAKAVPVLQLDGSFTKGQAVREKDEFYPTPPEPTRAFLAAEKDRLLELGSIWEPAAGDGAMVREMLAIGLDVFASDLVDRGMNAEIKSFYDYAEIPAACRGLLTNPPFADCGGGPRGKARWLRHALALPGMEYMALLLPWPWPGAAGLRKFWANTPPSRVYLCRWKIDFTGGGSPPMLNGWFVWDRAWKGETVLRMLDRDQDARQGGLL